MHPTPVAADRLGPSRNVLSLNGLWTVCLDPDDRGRAERWYARTLSGTQIPLPGALPEHGIGDPVDLDTPWTGSIFDRSFFTDPSYAVYREPDHFKVPFCLQPEVYFAGAAWYQREWVMPEEWSEDAILLVLERPHWVTEVWIDDVRVGTADSLSTPHEYVLPRMTAGTHRLTVRVDNTHLLVDIGENSHSITDHTQGNWNGIIGRLELRAVERERILRLDPFPDADAGSVRLRGTTVGVASGRTIQLEVRSPDGAVVGAGNATVNADQAFSAEIELNQPVRRWDEWDPALYTVVARLDESRDETVVSFGFRTLSVEGQQILFNDRPLFIRATLDCAAFPETGYPPMDAEAWERIFSVCRSQGLNTLRFHSWCPGEAAFAAADACGFFLHIEAASWPCWSTTLGNGKPVDAWLEEETERILATYGHHPSFLFMASGNEPEGPNHADWLGEWVERWRSRDPRRLYSTASAWPVRPESDFHVDTRQRLHQWGDNLNSAINARPPETASDFRKLLEGIDGPVISHEIGQWCAYPDLDEVERYPGYLKARNLEIFRDRLRENGLEALASAMHHASGKLQVLCYQAEIEAALRTPGMAGFHLLGLADFPGQGTAPVGVVDVFWKEKAYLLEGAYRRFCGPVVPLARLERRVFTTAETLTADVEIAHWGSESTVMTNVQWSLLAEDGSSVASGAFGSQPLEVGGPFALGRVEQPLRSLAAPARYRLEVSAENPACINSWDIWVYPEIEDKSNASSSQSCLVTSDADAAFRALKKGDRVLLAVGRDSLRGDNGEPVQLGFSPIFWNTAWTQNQAPHTLGILCEPDHPALSQFPTEFHSNWQWWYPIHQGGAMVLDDLPRELEPIVRVIDDWYKARSLALMIEARVGPGRLLLCGVDLLSATDPVNRQLLRSLSDYVAGEAFAPTVELSPAQVSSLLR